jgi:shikimate kinase
MDVAMEAVQRRSVFLVGPMGSGKTAVGRQLARRLGYRFVDSDAEIEARTGVDIPFIFEKEGELGFRAREKEIIDELSQQPGIVLGTGGGAILAEETRQRLAARGVVVYLDTSISQQVIRTRRSRDRPLLYTDDPRGMLESLMVVREPLYRSLAAITIATDGRKVAGVADEIVDRLRKLGLGDEGG